MAASKIITWNGVPSTVIPELVIGKVTREILGTNRGVQIDLDGREGSYHFPQKPGRRMITAECFILVDDMNDRGDAVEAVADWLEVLTEAQLILSDNPDRYYDAVLGTVPSPDEWRHAAIFDLEWMAQPYSLDLNVTPESWTSDSDDNHTWVPGLAVDVYPIIQIRPTNGTLTSMSLESNGTTLFWAGTVLMNNYLTVNSIIPMVLAGSNADTDLTGAYDPSLRSMSSVSGDFPVLLPDAMNNVHFVSTGGTATSFEIVVFYRKKYRR